MKKIITQYILSRITVKVKTKDAGLKGKRVLVIALFLWGTPMVFTQEIKSNGII